MTQSGKRVRLRLGGVPEHFNLPWHLLLESGALTRAKIDASWRDYYGGTGEMAEALDAGDVDLAMLLTEGAVAAVARGGQFRIVSVYTASPLIWGIHVPASSALYTVADLRDQVYAISRYGSGSHLMAGVHARDLNWPVDALRFEKVGNLDGARAALAEDRAQIFYWEKFTTQPYVDNGEFRCVGDYPTPWPCFVVAVSNRFLHDEPEACAVALRAVYANAFALSRQGDAVALIAQRYELLPENVAQWLSLTRWARTVEIDTDMIDQVAQTLLEVGLITPEQRAMPLTAEL